MITDGFYDTSHTAAATITAKAVQEQCSLGRNTKNLARSAESSINMLGSTDNILGSNYSLA